ncbi:glyoxalase [Amnibacterium flavum]|uniref:Glyoxalase n=2 Tax=Amnibacterium flavum TaxID=2173173 RepID=A0A2V1HQT7_9MICO|nr:glyoxalase [Amnibacterium flavum]
MGQQAHFITFATRDLDAARAFYIDGLGWHPLLDVPDEIVFFQIAPGLVLGLFESAKFASDLGIPVDETNVSGSTIAHNVGSPDEVRLITEAMAGAGGTTLVAPSPGAFGGIFHAIVRDPNGIVWEIAHNPGWSIAADGSVTFG